MAFLLLPLRLIPRTYYLTTQAVNPRLTILFFASGIWAAECYFLYSSSSSPQVPWLQFNSPFWAMKSHYCNRAATWTSSIYIWSRLWWSLRGYRHSQFSGSCSSTSRSPVLLRDQSDCKKDNQSSYLSWVEFKSDCWSINWKNLWLWPQGVVLRRLRSSLGERCFGHGLVAPVFWGLLVELWISDVSQLGRDEQAGEMGWG